MKGKQIIVKEIVNTLEYEDEIDDFDDLEDMDGRTLLGKFNYLKDTLKPTGECFDDDLEFDVNSDINVALLSRAGYFEWCGLLDSALKRKAFLIANPSLRMDFRNFWEVRNISDASARKTRQNDLLEIKSIHAKKIAFDRILAEMDDMDDWDYIFGDDDEKAAEAYEMYEKELEKFMSDGRLAGDFEAKDEYYMELADDREYYDDIMSDRMSKEATEYIEFHGDDDNPDRDEEYEIIESIMYHKYKMMEHRRRLERIYDSIDDVECFERGYYLEAYYPTGAPEAEDLIRDMKELVTYEDSVEKYIRDLIGLEDRFKNYIRFEKHIDGIVQKRYDDFHEYFEDFELYMEDGSLDDVTPEEDEYDSWW